MKAGAPVRDAEMVCTRANNRVAQASRVAYQHALGWLWESQPTAEECAAAPEASNQANSWSWLHLLRRLGRERVLARGAHANKLGLF
jgi:hypothetical protein